MTEAALVCSTSDHRDKIGGTGSSRGVGTYGVVNFDALLGKSEYSIPRRFRVRFLIRFWGENRHRINCTRIDFLSRFCGVPPLEEELADSGLDSGPILMAARFDGPESTPESSSESGRSRLPFDSHSIQRIGNSDFPYDAFAAVHQTRALTAPNRYPADRTPSRQLLISPAYVVHARTSSMHEEYLEEPENAHASPPRCRGQIPPQGEEGGRREEGAEADEGVLPSPHPPASIRHAHPTRKMEKEPAEEGWTQDGGHRCLRALLIAHAAWGYIAGRWSREGASNEWAAGSAARCLPVFLDQAPASGRISGEPHGWHRGREQAEEERGRAGMGGGFGGGAISSISLSGVPPPRLRLAVFPPVYHPVSSNASPLFPRTDSVWNLRARGRDEVILKLWTAGVKAKKRRFSLYSFDAISFTPQRTVYSDATGGNNGLNASPPSPPAFSHPAEVQI
ncbi:hypothetical protein K438DRAFT_2077452 [Mycena galopus ATCC 62051]|nr:hypothetical protein K438DRAFT_2077452 [Mycena galopus ATCC 62051]